MTEPCYFIRNACLQFGLRTKVTMFLRHGWTRSVDRTANETRRCGLFRVGTSQRVSPATTRTRTNWCGCSSEI